MPGQKTSLGKFKKIEITSSIFSDQNTMRLEINYTKKTAKTKTRQNEKPKETIKQIMKENFLELKIGTKM